jgi:hypothetical protein
MNLLSRELVASAFPFSQRAADNQVGAGAFLSLASPALLVHIGLPSGSALQTAIVTCLPHQ